jgi:hypothetical protein
MPIDIVDGFERMSGSAAKCRKAKAFATVSPANHFNKDPPISGAIHGT